MLRTPPALPTQLQIAHQQGIFQRYIGKRRQIEHMPVTRRNACRLALAVFGAPGVKRRLPWGVISSRPSPTAAVFHPHFSQLATPFTGQLTDKLLLFGDRAAAFIVLVFVMHMTA